LTSRKPVGFSKRTLLHGVSRYVKFKSHPKAQAGVHDKCQLFSRFYPTLMYQQAVATPSNMIFHNKPSTNSRFMTCERRRRHPAVAARGTSSKRSWCLSDSYFNFNLFPAHSYKHCSYVVCQRKLLFRYSVQLLSKFLMCEPHLVSCQPHVTNQSVLQLSATSKPWDSCTNMPPDCAVLSRPLVIATDCYQLTTGVRAVFGNADFRMTSRC
jgi:hypothetical protein